jgi:cellulose biosynthesis protein BcsQ
LKFILSKNENICVILRNDKIMKQVNLVLQSKGGVGKLLFMWFVAQVEKEAKSAFIDLDESTQTSLMRLGAIVGENRVKGFKILNENKKLEREKILNLFEVIANAKTDKWFVDFGASESEELRRLLEFDIVLITFQMN